MMIASFGWEMLFYIFIYIIVALSLVVVPLAMFLSFARSLLVYLSFGYFLCSISHVSMTCRIIYLAVKNGAGWFDGDWVYVMWSFAGAILFFVFALGLFVNKSAFVGRKICVYAYLALGLVPTAAVGFFG